MQKRILAISMSAVLLAGCATSTRYVGYSYDQFTPKDKAYVVSVYPSSQTSNVSKPYFVIGKVSIEGFAGNGVNPENLMAQARVLARKKGADAIINAETQVYHYYYGDALLRFTGELIVYPSSLPHS